MAKIKPTILVVDDELSIRESFTLILEDNYRVLSAASGEAALKKILDEKIDLVYLDIRMPGLDGMQTLKKIKEIDKDLTVVMVTAVNEVQKAGEAITLGAFNYVVKPFDVDLILSTTKQLLEKKKQNLPLSKEAAGLIGHSPAVLQLNQAIEKAAQSSEAVLIWGETGVEKETVASLIHLKSPLKAKPYHYFEIPAQITDSELNKILFGFGKSQLLENLTRKVGLFEKCSEGTLALANLENISAHLQEELVKIMEKKQIQRGGSLSPIPINLRLIGVTSIPPGELNPKLGGLFSKIKIEIPPLRKRSADLPLLVKHLIKNYNQLYALSITSLSEAALELLSGYPFFGNLEELEHFIKRIMLNQKKGQIEAKDLPLDVFLASADYKTETGLETLSADFKQQYFSRILKLCGNHKEKAAQALGINVRNL